MAHATPSQGGDSKIVIGGFFGVIFGRGICRPMKVAFINHPWDMMDLSALSGSLPIWTYEVASRLPTSHDITIYARRGSKQAATQSDGNLTVRRIETEVDPFEHKLLRRLPVVWSARKPFFASRLYYRSYIAQVAASLKAHPVDVVHIHNFAQYASIIRRAVPKAKICVHMHCEWLSQLDEGLVARCLAAVDAVFACSQYLVDRIIQKHPSAGHKCFCVHNGVNAEAFSPSPPAEAVASQSDSQRILFVGRLSPEKGVHVLIEAFEEIARRMPNAVLELVGPDGSAPKEFIVGLSDDERIKALSRFYDGDYASRLRTGCNAEAARRVQFIGGLPQSELVARYRSADVLVNPSLSEAFGMSLVEAMACGTCVVAAKTGGMTEIVEPEVTGLLVEADKAADLADAICRVLGDSTKRKDMGKAGRERVLKCFTWDTIADTVGNRYDELIRP
ncbi:MAG: glycosyltransferase family 4 protein [Phycisphaerales bacterium]|nr:glycosyltransferase family 4 protein [Phycisphaerales bacterium]